MTSLMIAATPLVSTEVAQGLRKTVQGLDWVSLVPSIGTDQHTVVLIAEPASALGALLQDGVPAETALHDWVTAAQSLTRAAKLGKGRADLVLLPRQGGALALPRWTPALALDAPADGVAPWMSVAANALIAADDTARAVASHLMQSVLPGVTTPGPVHLPDLLAQVADLQAAFAPLDAARAAGALAPQHHIEARLAATVAALDQMLGMVEEQIEGLEFLEKAKARADEELKRLRARQAEHAVAQTELAALQASTHAMQAKADAMRDAQRQRETVLAAKLVDDGARLYRMACEIRDHEKWIATLQQDIAMLQAELDKIYGSKSWRVTAPLRSLRQRLPAGERP